MIHSFIHSTRDDDARGDTRTHARAHKRTQTHLHRSPRDLDPARDVRRARLTLFTRHHLWCREWRASSRRRARSSPRLALALSLARPVFASPSIDARSPASSSWTEPREPMDYRRRRCSAAGNVLARSASIETNTNARTSIKPRRDARSRFDVVRTWAFMDGNEKSFDGRFTQGTRGDFRESSHAALDRLLTTCREKNLRVILTLTNYWPDYGGIDRYVEWAREEGDSNARRREDFYTSTKCRDAFARHVEFLAGRRNTVTGELYRDDPTIFSYQIDQRTSRGGDTSDGAVFEEWVRAFAETIRRARRRSTLVSVGTEGFFASPSAAAR